MFYFIISTKSKNCPVQTCGFSDLYGESSFSNELCWKRMLLLYDLNISSALNIAYVNTRGRHGRNER